jgi:N-acetylglutamate synthase-like GNAT family acetyltransferase
MDIKQATTHQEQNELDQLLWDVLWKPLNFKRDIRETFKLHMPQIDLIAIDQDVIIGALVANWLSSDEIEIHHIAVKRDFQKKAVGRMLFEELSRLTQDITPLTITTYARNTSIGFFSKLGFEPVGSRLEVEGFMEQGIWLQQMSVTNLGYHQA